MKNFALLFSSLAVTSTAFAAVPEVSAELASVAKSPVETVQLSYQANKFGKALSEKSVAKSKKMLKKAPVAKAGTMSVSYEEPAGIFSLGLSENLRGFTGYAYRKGPAYIPLKWINTSEGATEFEWEVIKDFQTGETEFVQTENFEYSPVYSLMDGPILYGMDADGNSGVFQFGTPNVSATELGDPTVQYFFGGDCAPDGTTDFGMSTYMYSQNGTSFIGVDFMQFANDSKDVDPKTHIDPIFTDPEGFGFVDPHFIGYGNRFEAPASPYVISKMWSWMSVSVIKPTVIEMTLYKVEEDGSVTDEILAAGSASVAKDTEMLVFDLYSLDEDGLETDDPIVIDSAVFAVMTFNNDDIAQVYPVAGDGALYPNGEINPYTVNGYMILEDEGTEYFARPPFSYFADESRTTMVAVTDWLWMVDAIFPWTVSADGVSVAQAPVEGGKVSFKINSYFGIQYFSYYLPEGSEWIDLDNADITVDQELNCQVLNLPVAALPEGVEGRSATIEIEGIGTGMSVTINQGEVSAVSVVVSDKNAVYYDLQGRRVANPEKGIFIKKTGNKAEKVIL